MIEKREVAVVRVQPLTNTHHTFFSFSFLFLPTGVDAEEAKTRINTDMPGLNIIVLPKVWMLRREEG